jgi:dTDP-4-amino-4,6-dideoxygalactose transaminase
MKIEVYSPTIRRKEMDAVLTAMVEDKIGPGEYAQRLIQIAKERLGYDYCLALRSPAIALYLALKSLNLEDGQGVVVSALSPRYYKQVIEGMRLVPLYCDVLPSSACVGSGTIEALFARKPEASPRCIVLHHTLGFMPDMPAIAGLGLPVIEDCSQSYGTILGEGDEASSGPYTGTLSILGLEEKDMITGGAGPCCTRPAAGTLRSCAARRTCPRNTACRI